MGVRALLDDAEELARTPEGYRQFRRITRDETHLFSVDPRTQLIVAEQEYGPSDSMMVHREWQAVAGGHVRTRSVFTTVDHIAGRRVQSDVILTFQRVRVSAPLFHATTLVGPDN